MIRIATAFDLAAAKTIAPRIENSRKRMAIQASGSLLAPTYRRYASAKLLSRHGPMALWICRGVLNHPTSWGHGGRVPRGSFGLGGFRQDRVSPNVHPVVLPGWHMTQLAVGRVVGRHVFLRVLRLEQGPAPAVAPQIVLGESPLRVLDHHEPDLDVFSPG